MKPDRGKILAIVVERTGLNKEEVARKAGYSRSAYYKHIENPDLEDHIMIAYGKAIKHDFTDEIPEMHKYVLYDPEENYGKPITVDEALKQRDHWKDKYIELLEKYNRMIEDKMNIRV